MAEAHAAVAFQFTVTSDGLRLHVSSEALEAVYLSGARSWRKRITRFLNRFHSGVYPASFSSLFYLLLVVVVTTCVGFDVTFEQRNKIEQWLPLEMDGLVSNVISSVVCATVAWVMVVLAIRYILKMLLCYHGWMFEAHRKTSLFTKIWGMLIKLMSGSCRLFSYQSSLPRLPVPPIDATVKRYLRSVRPLYKDAEYNEIVELADEFKSTIANRLQRYLVLKSWWSSNYVSDWWEQYVYLAGRDPIMVNSNYYGMDLLYLQPTQIQTARAATMTHALLAYRSILDKELIKPIKIAGMVPLCSWQYERIFNTTRIPGLAMDQIMHLTDSKHVAVYHRGRWFKLVAYKNGSLLTPREFEELFESIVKDETEPDPGEENLAAFTAGGRKEWAEARIKYFSDKTNKQSLSVIEQAAFVVILDEEDHTIVGEDAEALSSFGRSLLHGNCNNRWFDKSMTMVIFKNGRFGMNAEHSWADAPVVSHCVEEILYQEFFNLKYREDGKCAGDYTKKPIPVQKLKWNLPKECIDDLSLCLEGAKYLANDVDLQILPFTAFGKGVVKKFKMSPDAFIQLSLQLANYRDKGHFCLTYEASMTRLYREGRTETVRSLTNESSAFVLAMENKESTDKERFALFRTAAEKHVDTYKEAMTGKGIDRHLFCLYIMSKYLQVESPFLQKVLHEPWSLSTSQTPQQQMGKIDMNKHPNVISPGGGFGPDSKRFSENINQAMLDIRQLCESQINKNNTHA